MNSNGLMLLNKCTEHSLVITNTLFRMKDRHKGTWRHPRSRHWHIIDYVITRKRDRQCVLNTRAITGSDSCFTANRMVRSVFRLKLRKKSRQQPRLTLNVEALNQSIVKQDFQASLNDKLPALEEKTSVDTTWNALNACSETIGPKRKKHQDWFDDNDEELLKLVSEYRAAFINWQQLPKTRSRRQKLTKAKANLQRRTRQLKNQWWLRFWTEEQIPADLRDALIVTLFKKGDKSLCSNYRGISLLSAVGKLFAKILLNRLTPLAEEVLPESQCGFRPLRGIIDMIFALRQIQEKCREQRVPLCLIFIDLIHRDTLWQILAKCPGKLVKMIRLLHDDMTAAVLFNGKSSEPFSCSRSNKVV
ncbi:uncharacterized protein [Montipora foliosa]|uniref:uncharacterized protein n=1 Tax=Montipora foliosa TaxID=591990 RepID=UPI0035F1A024